MQLTRRGVMLILSSPSGAGKTTVSRRVLAEEPELEMSVSVTTRPPREGEVEGKDYRFVDDIVFAQMVGDDTFLEHAQVFGHSYGTLRAHVEETLAAGRDMLFDIDWQGAQQLVVRARDDVASAFLLPPSMENLADRLRTRAKDPENVIAERMTRAASEMSHWAEYDYVLVNEDLEDTVVSVRQILRAERHRTHRQPRIAEFVQRMR